MSQPTQRFLLALAAIAAGVVLYSMGQNEPGMLLIGAAVGFLGGGMKKATPPPVALLLAFLLVGCTPGQAYVAADQGIFDAITPEYLNYVGSDESLTDDQKSRRSRTVATWKILLDKAGESK